MTTTPTFEPQNAHRFFSAGCFNKTWDLLEKAQRSPEEGEQMLLLSLASLWHWTQRNDVRPQNLSIGYWQVSRVYAVLGQAQNALWFAERGLAVSENLPPFFQAYAHEALSRAAALAGDTERATLERAAAEGILSQITDPEEREALEKDLATLPTI